MSRSLSFALPFVALAGVLLSPAARADEEPTARRSPKHAEYAASLWEFLHRDELPYEDWTVVRAELHWPFGPSAKRQKTYANSRAVSNTGAYGAVFVSEHFTDGDAEELLGVAVRYRVKAGYDATTADWYWAYYLPDGTVVKTSVDRPEHDRPGYVTRVEDGRLWVMSLDDPALESFVRGTPPDKHVTRVGGGPGGATVKGTSGEAIDLYLATKPGFTVRIDDGRYWVFRTGTEALVQYDGGTPPGEQAIRPGAGPGGATLKAPDAETLDAYLIAAPGFDTVLLDGRVWVLRSGSEEAAAFRKDGEPAEMVTRPGAGPGNRTVRAVDRETLDAYLKALGLAE